LEPLVKRPLHLGALFTYEHSSGEMALCRVFSWHPETAVQAALLDVPEEKKVVYE